MPPLVELARSLEPVIRAHAEQIERDHTIPQSLAELLYDAGVFRAYLPRELGGLEVHPVEWLDMVEELSRINADVGWLAMINNGGTRLRPDVMREILAEHGRWIVTTSSGRVGGKAYRVDGGYRITGRWPFASGAPHARFLAGPAVLHDAHDNVVINPTDGQPWVVLAYFPVERTRILPTWDGLGLCGTGSHDFTVDDLFVPERYIGAGRNERPYPGPLYKAQFVLMAHAAHAIGIARTALDAFIAMTHRPPAPGSRRQASLGKQQLHQIAVGKADALVRAARAFAWDATAQVYAVAEHTDEVGIAWRALLAESIIFAVHACKQAVDLVFEASGAGGVYRGETLERCFRDIHTAAQHIIIHESRYDVIGQYYLTRDLPGGPIIEGLFPL